MGPHLVNVHLDHGYSRKDHHAAKEENLVVIHLKNIDTCIELKGVTKPMLRCYVEKDVPCKYLDGVIKNTLTCQPASGIIDTGSSMSLISHSVALGNHKLLPCEKKTVKGLGGSSTSADNLTYVKLLIGNRVLTHPVLVMEVDMPVDVILGTDFLRKWVQSLEFKTKMMNNDYPGEYNSYSKQFLEHPEMNIKKFKAINWPVPVECTSDVVQGKQSVILDPLSNEVLSRVIEIEGSMNQEVDITHYRLLYDPYDALFNMIWDQLTRGQLGSTVSTEWPAINVNELENIMDALVVTGSSKNTLSRSHDSVHAHENLERTTVPLIERIE